MKMLTILRIAEICQRVRVEEDVLIERELVFIPEVEGNLRQSSASALSARRVLHCASAAHLCHHAFLLRLTTLTCPFLNRGVPAAGELNTSGVDDDDEDDAYAPPVLLSLRFGVLYALSRACGGVNDERCPRRRATA